MYKNNLFISILLSISIFTSYFYFVSYDSDKNYLQQYEYDIKLLNVEKKNPSSVFRNDGEGKFFIHPGNIKETQGIFSFSKSYKFIFTFSLNKGAKAGKIKFTLHKNNTILDTFIIDAHNMTHKSINISVLKNDEIMVSADKFGETTYDWGSLVIEKISIFDDIKQYTIPILWILFLLFLVQSKFTYVGVLFYSIFLVSIHAERLNFSIVSFDLLVAYTLLYFLFTLILLILHYIFNRYYISLLLSTIISLIVLMIPLVFIIYIEIFSTAVTQDILFAVFQTNISESWEFVLSFIDMKYLGYILIVLILISSLYFFQSKLKVFIQNKLTLLFILASFFLATLTQFDNIQIFTTVINSYEKYTKEVNLFIQEQKRRKTNTIKFQAIKKNNHETHIVIIGESLNKNHMGIYGYHRDTTPLLSKMKDNNELLIFDNIYSNHTVTTHTLSLALTQASQYNQLKFYQSISIIELLNKANFETYWITAQPTHGSFQNLISVIATEANHFKTVNITDIPQGLDGAVIKKVESALKQSSKNNKVIFVHLQGSHYSYTSRYPKDTFNIYNKALKISEFGPRLTHNKLINHYDNSVAYNDYVVGSILKLLQKHQGTRSFVYMPDHAEDVLSQKAHNPSLFTYSMTQIPMVMWFSDEYKNKYNLLYKNLQKNLHALFSNDMLYDTLIGIMGVNTDKYEEKFDLSSSKYHLDNKKALVLHGAKKYTDKNNILYWQKKNAQYIVDNNISTRVLTHQLNSTAKLNDIWNHGLRSYKIDIIFDNTTQNFRLQHNKQEISLTLEKLLSTIEYQKIDKLWLSIKNMDKNNYKNILNRLNIIHNTFNIKNKSILEINHKENYIHSYVKNNWHVSYLLIPEKIVEYINKNDIINMQKIAKILAEQIKTQKISAISFVPELYPFIKSYLYKTLIDTDIVFHSYGGIPHLKDYQFIKKLLHSELFLDNKIENILFDFESKY